ncbi:iron-sulfur cluster biosynthesis family protein [Evansella halocellulosilytica]|uniref:iron-sulfur cluster biosynthesis family protein n=1 Tax=Evansella halocellulosilytica TaxID=2011013 RepID=UPI000BB843F3|nr:iron-sulfur cluster biosynthesis family protein [Evansella halocellulosilytica]
MNVQITSKAIAELRKRSTDLTSNVLLIKYDTDGCGCVVSGVSKLLEIENSGAYESVPCEPNTVRVAIEGQYKWAYDKQIMIDYSDTAKMFQLKSPNQMLNPRMTFLPLT